VSEVTLADGNQASIGDLIITRSNDRRLRLTATDWVKNGDRWTSTHVGKALSPPPARRQQSQPQPQSGSVHSGSQWQHTMVLNNRKSPPLTVSGAPAARQRRWAVLRRQRLHHGHHLLAQSAQPGHLFIRIGKPAIQQLLSRFAGADTGITDCQQVLDVAELQAQALRALDELQPVDYARLIQAIAGRCSSRGSRRPAFS
jgi:hypothetical protein